MKILIATDGSEYSKVAVAEACNFIAEPENTEIIVVSAYEDAFPITAEPFALSAEYYQKIEEAVKEQATRFIQEAADEIVARFPGKALDLSTEVLRGSPDREIVEYAKKFKCDLIVVGSHGRGFWGRMLGSVSDGVVHHAPCSVLVVRTAHK
ncbi:MAG TPA: universal stress protein [Pyrinomonadaceae bacterium]|nr:universal stress protein [Chloracidobacterium sp.]MBP9934990.1 universal stress protein [Pyrinomonadaceae bacterium]MBK7801384.1 universal stress protein [Chloracidobacterium sp.]MBK9436703.1 universal stress protein [Chloracidobacterium sp.]MBK9766328.1 universal stress protein [Chloracidobacterium sp.]